MSTDKRSKGLVIDPGATMGFCNYIGEGTYIIGSVKGNPIEQLDFVESMLSHFFKDRDEIVIAFELMQHMRNAKTIRSLSERVGFLKYSLIDMGYETVEVSTPAARKHSGVKNKVEANTYCQTMVDLFGRGFDKPVSQDMSDALILAIFHFEADPKEILCL